MRHITTNRNRASSLRSARSRPRLTISPSLALQIVDEERAYWRTAGRYVLIAAVMGGLVLGIVALTNFLETLYPGPKGAILFSMDISGSSALAGMGILSALIVALQISVRAGIPVDRAEVARAIARTRAIETTAMISGVAALGLGLVTAASFTHGVHTFDVVRQGGPLAGGAFLAVIAADASNVTESRLGSSLRWAARELRRRGLQGAIDKENTVSSKPTRRLMAPQILIAVVVLMIAGVVTLISGNTSSPVWSFLVSFSIAAGVIAFTTYFLSAARQQRLKRQYWWTFSIYAMFGFVLFYVLCLILLLLFSELAQGSASLGGLPARLAADLVLPLIAGGFASGRLACGGRGLGLDLAIRSMQRELAKSSRRPDST
jgi:hypothetical protein